MTGQILEYEKFLEKDAKKMARKDFLELHREMVAAFQHERLIHLLVTLFFGFLTILGFICAATLTILFGFDAWLAPIYILAVVLLVLEMFYVRHYYFLENHTQEMYKYFRQEK